MKRFAFVLAAIIIVLLASCSQEPAGESALIECCNMTMYNCGWRFTGEHEGEIFPIKAYGPGSKIRYEAGKDSSYTVEFYLLDDSTYNLETDAIITENMIIGSMTADILTESDLSLLMFLYDEDEGIILRRSNI